MKSSKFFLSTLIAAAAMTATAYADYSFSETGTVTVTADTSHDVVTVDSGVTGTFDITTNNADLKIESLALTGNLVINEPTCALAELGNISGSGDITLSKTTANNWGGALVLSGDSTGYTGTINIWNGGNATNNPSAYSQFLILKSANAAGSANISLGAATVLIVSADSTSIGGLSSSDANTSVVSQASSFGYGADPNPYKTYYSGSLPNNDGTHRTLNITGAGTYEFKGTFGSSTNIGSLSLNWSGSGSQTFSGNTYVNDLTVSAGALSLTGNTTIGGAITNAGTLTLGGTVTLSSGITNTGTVVLNDGVIFDLGGFNFTDGENAIVSGGTVTDGITSANFQNVGVMRGGSFSVNSTTSSLAVTLTQGVAETLTWGGVADAVWNTSTDNNSVWTLSEGETTSFYFKDNVVFGADAENKTVLLESGNTVTVGTATVSGGEYTLASNSDGTATVVGSTLTIESGASLTVGDVGNNTSKHVALDFDNISVAGTLNFNTIRENTWSSLTFEDGGKLHFTDGSPSVTNLTVESVTLNGETTISAGSDKKFAIGTLSGSGALVITGSSNWGALGISIDDLTNYSGSMSISGGKKGAVVSTGVTQIVGKTVAVGDNATLSLLQSADSNGNTHDLSSVSGSGTLELGLFSNGQGDGDGFNLSNFEGTIVVGKASNADQGRLLLSSSTLNKNAQIRVIDGGLLVFNGTGTDISNNITFDANSTIHANENMNGTLSGDLTATGTITKAGRGVLTLTGNANLAKVTVSGGTLNIGDGGVLTVTGDDNSTSEITGTINVLAGGSAKFAGHDLMGWSQNSNAIAVLTGSNEKKATLYLNDTGNLTFTSVVKMNGNAAVTADDGAKLLNTFGGKFVATGTNNTISDVQIQLRLASEVEVTGASDTLEISSEIASHGEGTGGLTKTGLGKLILSGENTFSTGAGGATRVLTVSEGTLVAANASALGEGATVVNSRAMLTFATTVSGVTGGVALNEGATFAIDLTNFAQTVSEGDKVGFAILTDTALTFNGADAGTLTSDSIAGYFDVEGSTLGTYSEWAREWSYAGNTLSLTMTIPEPSLFGFLAGLGALTLVGTRRRRGKKA